MRALRIGAVVLLLALTAAGLRAFAQWRFDAYLSGRAVQALAEDARGETPWRWKFTDSENLVAGRVFDAGNFAFTDGTLTVQSDGRAFEIGLPLPSPLDLRRFPQLDISATVDAPGSLRLVVAQVLDQPALYSAPIALVPQQTPYRANCPELAWQNKSAPAPMPSHGAMLRLRVELPAGAAFRLMQVSAVRVPIMKWADLSTMVDISHSVQTSTVGVATPSPILVSLDAATDLIPQPVLLLKPDSSIERQRAFLERARTLIPAAIIVPAPAAGAVEARAHALGSEANAMRSLRNVAWIALGAYWSALLLAWRWPPRDPRWRAALEAALVSIAPLWLIAGGFFTGRLDAAQIALIASVVAYVAFLGIPRDWRLNGSARAWLLGAGVAAIALAIGLCAHRWDEPLRAIGSGHVLRYFGWALIQQYLICAIVTSRWLRASASRFAAIYLGALTFALMHTPNASLMLATFAGGLCWCALYLRERALLPLAVSHAASALVLIALLPQDWLYSAEVSARFFQ